MVATSTLRGTMRIITTWVILLAVPLLLLRAMQCTAAVLPEDRLDIEYSNFSGGGVDIDVPMVLVRKKIGDKVSVSGHYVVDNVSGASIDVQVAASPYSEKRTEYAAGVDYLHEKTIMSLGYIKSTENDHDGDKVTAGVSQEVFGNMTTVSFGIGSTSDEITKTGAPDFSKSMTSQNIRIGVSQVITKNALLALDFEEISDEGYLQNPYRFVRVRDFDDVGNQTNLLRPEVYPKVRTSDAYALRGRYYLPYRAAIQAEYRTFRDTWDMGSDTYFIGYTHPWKEWIFDGSVRFYRQNAADFYYDSLLIDHQYTYQARDKELSSMESLTLGVKASYEVPYHWWSAIDRTILSLHIDRVKYDYNNFRDLRATNDSNWGNEPLYGFTANVVRLYFSFRF